MPRRQLVHIYLEDALRQSALAGRHNFLNLLVDVLKKSRFRVEFHPHPLEDDAPNVLSISHMATPPTDRGLVFRRVYHYPFWQIDAVAQRWHWDMAKASFDPALAAPDAERFYGFWQKRLFGDAPAETSRDGFIYVPLQGRLSQHRVFQSCSPLEMVEHCLDNANGRKVVVALHPRERYTTADLSALHQLEDRHAQLQVTTGRMERLLQTCDFVVTQNSSVAFSGYFFGKSALLFGQIDFHHIAEKADLTRIAQSFKNVAKAQPPFSTYVWWFWQQQSINAGRPDARSKIAARLQRFGWI